MFKVIVVLGAIWLVQGADGTSKVREVSRLDTQPASTYDTLAQCRDALKTDPSVDAWAASRLKKFVQDSEYYNDEAATLAAKRIRTRCAQAPIDRPEILSEGF